MTRIPITGVPWKHPERTSRIRFSSRGAERDPDSTKKSNRKGTHNKIHASLAIALSSLLQIRAQCPRAA